MTESELRDILLGIRNNLKILIGTDLGKYEITSPTGQKLNEIDAIWVEPPELPANYKVKLNSGIEANMKIVSEGSFLLKAEFLKSLSGNEE